MVADAVNAPHSPHATKPVRRSRIKHVFIVSPARSGSTLLRYLLDAHPDIVSPAELNLSALLLHAADTWHRAHEGQGTTDPGAEAQGPAEPVAEPRTSWALRCRPMPCAGRPRSSTKSWPTWCELPAPLLSWTSRWPPSTSFRLWPAATRRPTTSSCTATR